MAMQPKPIILHTGRSYTVAQRREREKREDEYRVGRLKLEPPDELSDRAKEKFRQIVNEAFWLDELSVDLLAAYCHAWDRWLDCVAHMEGTDEVILTRNSKDEAVAKQNPYRYPLKSYVTMMQELSAKLGLGNIDRLRLINPVSAEEAKQQKVENPFEQFMTAVE